MSVVGQFLNQENIIKKVFDATSNSLRITGTISVPAPIGGATEAEQQTQTGLLTSIDTKLTSPVAVTGSLTIAPNEIYTSSAFIDTSVTNIPASASLPLTLFASTAQITKEIQVIEDIGEFLALYTGTSGSEVMLCALPLGGGEVKVNVPAGTRLSIKSLKNVAVTSATNLIINLLK